MRSRRRASRRRHESVPLGTYVKAGIAILMLVGIGTVAVFKTRQDVDRGADYCSVSKIPGAIIALAIDASDPFEAVQGLAIDNKIKATVGTLNKGDRLDIYEVNAAQGGLATRTFSMCNPGDQTTLDALTTNENDDERNYKAKFQASLAHALKAAVDQKSSAQSPILESLRAIAQTSFPLDMPQSHKRLILVSDLVQNTSTYSMFKSGEDNFSTFKTSAQYADAAADFAGIDFDLLVIARERYAKHQTRALLNWWEQYITENGGRLVRYRRV